MSYCRWSSMGFMCDVYVYENVAGCWTTHVAGNRITKPAPELDTSSVELFRITRARQAEHLATAKRAPIGLPHDGETFHDETPGDCAKRLRELMALGYIVPQYAIDALEAEQAEMVE